MRGITVNRTMTPNIQRRESMSRARASTLIFNASSLVSNASILVSTMRISALVANSDSRWASWKALEMASQPPSLFVAEIGVF